MKKPENKYKWRATPEGAMLFELVEYEQADTSLGSEVTKVLGGLFFFDDYVSGYVMRGEEKRYLTTRFHPETAKNDVILRLTEMGYTIKLDEPTEA